MAASYGAKTMFVIGTMFREGGQILDRIGRGLHSSTSRLNLSRVCHKKTPYTP
jgi:hypothetical protein